MTTPRDDSRDTSRDDSLDPQVEHAVENPTPTAADATTEIPAVPTNPQAPSLSELSLFAPRADDGEAPSFDAPAAAAVPASGPRGAWQRARARFPRLATPLVASLAAFVLVAGAAGGAVALAHKTIELDVDGQQVAVSTFAGSVEGLLEQQGISLGEHDVVEPALDVALASGDEIVVRHAQQVDVVVDGEEQTVWTTALDAGEAVATLAGSGRDVSMVASRSGNRAELDLPLVVDGRVVIEVDGEVHELVVRGEATVHDVLRQAGIQLGNADTVEIGAREDGTPLVTIARVEITRRVTTEAIPFSSSEVSSDDYYEGTSRVTTEGVDGVRERRYTVTTIDGEEVSADLTMEIVTQQPVNEVVTVGTAERPAPQPAAPAPGGGGGGTGGGGGGTVPTGDVWAALAQCESGGNPATNTGNGYYGLYQFSLSTWQSVGGSGLPSDASAEEQTMRAQILQQRSGWGQWPACARQLGLI